MNGGRNGRMAEMATYVLFTVHTDDNIDTNDNTLIFYSIDSEGKLGKDLWYCTFGGNPFSPCFCPLFDGPSPPLERSSRKYSQK